MVPLGGTPTIPLSYTNRKKCGSKKVKDKKENGHTMTDETKQPQQLQLLNRIQAIPLIELALSKSASTYARIKDSNQLINWALSTAESSLSVASKQAAPYARKLETPISYVDQKLCRGLDLVEKRMPIVKQLPGVIIEDAYSVAVGKVAPAVKSISDASEFLRSQASSMKAAGWTKANKILDSYYGAKAIDGLTSTANVIDALIDKYFPPLGEEVGSELVPLEKDKLMHTLQTIGRLPIKAARRLYGRVVRQLPSLGSDSLRLYTSQLLEFLRLSSQLTDSRDGSANGRPVIAASTPAKARVSFETGTKLARD